MHDGYDHINNEKLILLRQILANAKVVERLETAIALGEENAGREFAGAEDTVPTDAARADLAATLWTQTFTDASSLDAIYNPPEPEE
jgi:hypothetical protein